MAKIIEIKKNERGEVSFLSSWRQQKSVSILKMKQSSDGRPRRDHRAALQLGLELKRFTLVTTKGKEEIWGIEGPLDLLQSLQLKIGKAAYDIVKAEGGGKRYRSSPKERWHFIT